MATYTTAALVKLRIENVDASLTDDNIEDYIEGAEGTLRAIMGTDWLGVDHTFDSAKHGILREATTVYSAYCAILFNPAGFTSTSEAMSIADGLWQQWVQLLGLCANKSIIAYLEGL